MRINARFHPGQSRRNITQNNLSETANRGCGHRRFKTAICCRRARFSMNRSRRERRVWVAKTKRSLSKRNMRTVLHESMLRQADPYLFDLKVDRYFGEPPGWLEPLSSLLSGLGFGAHRPGLCGRWPVHRPLPQAPDPRAGQQKLARLPRTHRTISSPRSARHRRSFNPASSYLREPIRSMTYSTQKSTNRLICSRPDQ